MSGPKSHTVADDDAHTVLCECGWMSQGWPTQKAAKLRKAEHDKEHETGEPAPELADSEASK